MNRRGEGGVAVGSCKRRAHIAECRWPHRYAATTTIFTSFFVPLYSAAARTEVNLSSITRHILAHTHTHSKWHTHTQREGLGLAHTFATSANDVKMSFAGNERRHRRQKVEPQLEPEIGDQLSCRWAAAFGYQITPIHTQTPRRHTHTRTHIQQLTALPCSKFVASSEQKAHKVRN